MQSKRDVVRAVLAGELDAAAAGGEQVTETESETERESGEAKPPLDAGLKSAVDEAARVLADEPDVALAHFRDFYDDDELTAKDVGLLIDAATFAVDHPEAFYDLVLADELPETEREGRVGDWFNRVRAYVHAPKNASGSQKQQLEALASQYGNEALKAINPNIRRFETYDPGWLGAWQGKVGEWAGWPDLADFRPHSHDRDYVYMGSDDIDASIKVALFADFGNGTYQARGVARGIAAASYPHAFHLGDVYYKGSGAEFRKYFREPLEDVTAKSELFALPENHELYTGGAEYLNYVDGLRESDKTRQQGSYFCVRYPHHQIIGLDVNWEHRQHLVPDSPQCAWLQYVLANGGDRTNILLTGSAPYVYGSSSPQALLEDMQPYLDRVHFWFWGDNHYCALFDKQPQKAPFYGSCIGHGGYPFKKYEDAKDTFEVEKLWVETAARFPDWTGLRQDMGNNGWCEMTLQPDGGVELLYIDWLGARRCRFAFDRKVGPGAQFEVRRTPDGQICELWNRPAEGETTDELRARGVLHGS